MTLASSSKTDNLLKLYQQDADSKIITPPEIMRLNKKWKKQDIVSLTTNAIDALEACNANLLTNARKLLTILATLPLTTATRERSFSIMRR